MDFERMKEFHSELTAGWAEATESEDKVVNTKVVIRQAKEAQKAISRVIAVSAKIGGADEALSATFLGMQLENVFDGYSNASIIIATAIELMASLDVLIRVAEEGIKDVEAKGRN